MVVQTHLYPENLGLPMCGLQQDWGVVNPVPAIDDAHDLCFTLHQDPQRHHYHHHLFGHHQQSVQNDIGVFDNNRGGASYSSTSTCGSSIFSPMALSQSLHTEHELQRQEIDCFLQIQSERLRSALQEQRKRELVLLKSMESKAVNLIRQKEDDLAQATKKAMELEACLKKAEMESESWQRLARANEAIVVDLSNTLDQVRERLVLVSNRADDAESNCCGSCNDHNREQEELRKEAESEKKMAAACKRCNSRNSCVLCLPCRHICSCKQCEAFLVSCPVCKSAKEASMEVFWF